MINLQTNNKLYKDVYHFVTSILPPSKKIINSDVKTIHDIINYYKNADMTYNDLVMYISLKIANVLNNQPPQKALIYDDTYDIHNMLVDIINKPDAAGLNINKIRNGVGSNSGREILQTNDNNNIKSILKYPSLEKFAYAFNPALQYKKAYITLDSKYARFLDDNTKLQWDYSDMLTESAFSTNSVNTIKNVVKVHIYSAVLTPQFTSPMKRGTILIEEFKSQSFIAQNGRRFHMMGLLNDLALPLSIANRSAIPQSYGYTPDISLVDKYEILAGFRFNEGMYYFNKPFTNFNTLTLSFGNPFDLINIRKHVINNCSFESINMLPLDGDPLVDDYYGNFDIECGENHYVPGTIHSLKISGFTTDDPVTDADWITYINNNEFTLIDRLDDTRLRIYPTSVNPPGVHPKRIGRGSTTMGNAPSGTPSTFTITFDTVRTIVNIEFTYIDE